MFVWKDENNRKSGRGWPIFFKKTYMNHPWTIYLQVPAVGFFLPWNFYLFTHNVNNSLCSLTPFHSFVWLNQNLFNSDPSSYNVREYSLDWNSVWSTLHRYLWWCQIKTKVKRKREMWERKQERETLRYLQLYKQFFI